MTDPKKPRTRFRLRRLARFRLRTTLVAVTGLAVWLSLHVRSFIFRPRRLSFSLRTTLIAMAALAVGLGLHRNSVRKQRAAIEMVKRHGGWVHYDYETDGLFHNMNADSSVPAWLLTALGPDHFHSVVAVGTDGGRSNGESIADDVLLEHEACEQLSSFPKLQDLSLDIPQLSDRELKYVGQLTALRRLSIRRADNITEQGVVHLANLNQLEDLRLHHIQLSDESIRTLARLPKLQHLRFRGVGFTGKELAHLQNTTQLRHIEFYGDRNAFTDADFTHLTQLTQLEVIRLDGSQMTGEGLVNLEQLKQLKTLHFADSEITDSGLSHLKELTQLEHLGIEGSQVTEAGLRHLVDLKNLRVLVLVETQVSDVSWLEERLPNCQIFLTKRYPYFEISRFW